MRGTQVISAIKNKYAALRATESLFFGIGGGAAVWVITYVITHNNAAAISAGVLGGIAVLLGRIKQIGLLSLNNERIAYFLDRQFAELKDSTDLILKPASSLSSLEQIQLQRTSQAVSELAKVRLPHQLPLAAAVLVTCLLSAVTVFVYLPTPVSTTSTGTLQQNGSPTEEAVAPDISEHRLAIQPPSYTTLPASTSDHLSVKLPEGSGLTWTLSFSGQVDHAWMQFTNGDSISFNAAQDKFTASRTIRESMIYRVRWAKAGTTFSSDYFELTSKPDQPPIVQIRGLEQFTRLKWGDRTHVDVPAFLRDDFGLTSGYIVATVSKGSGESVKFREEKLPFQSPSKINGNDVKATRRIDFNALGMDPGDEVYFYAEAWDNRSPDPQRNRTETYFVSLQDTASQVVTTDASLGVDLMPDYFRSQRQIIIDTEKLLKDQPKISKQTFNSTSNELGYDQKVLRLKYGQFLGEEFETTIGEPAHEEDTDEEGETDPAKKYGHQHDKDNEHNLVAAKKQETDHAHKEDDNKDPSEAYKHNHDNMEEATFFTMSVRAKLKAALTLMWESELQLRLFAPKESLPVQYKILNLLREISQDSRIYVHRMGFDPPPLKEDRRLTGDLAEIGNPKAISVPAQEEKYPAIRKVLNAIQAVLKQGDVAMDNNLKSSLEAAAAEIAEASLDHPGDYLIQLSQIRAIIDGTMIPSDIPHALTDIQAACWNILPQPEPGPHQGEQTRHSLDTKLLDELKKPANE